MGTAPIEAEVCPLLDATRYDLALLRSSCVRIKEQVSAGITIMIGIQAPVLDALLGDPILHEYGSHGFIMALRYVSIPIATASNAMDHHRLSAAVRGSLTPGEVADAQDRIDDLIRVIGVCSRVDR
jgi:hypothetical protein